MVEVRVGNLNSGFLKASGWAQRSHIFRYIPRNQTRPHKTHKFTSKHWEVKRKYEAKESRRRILGVSHCKV
jgi:hypothetical protein